MFFLQEISFRILIAEYFRYKIPKELSKYMFNFSNSSCFKIVLFFEIQNTFLKRIAEKLIFL